MSRRGWVLFTAMSLIWGVPYLLIKVAAAKCRGSGRAGHRGSRHRPLMTVPVP